MMSAADESRTFCIIKMITASISFVASVTLIVLIARSRARFSTTQNRLLVGLSVSDIILSLSVAFTTIPMPRGTPNVWLALGNNATCDFQGFLHLFGLLNSPAYNASLCTFFLLKVRYDVSDEIMTRRVEPFLHGIPLLNSLIICIHFLVKEYFNPITSTVCYVSDFPRKCSYKFLDMTCERGEGFYFDLMVKYGKIYSGAITPLIIIGTMLTLYLTVHCQERRMDGYGVGSLNLSPQRRRQSRHVRMTMYRALAYFLAWFVPFIVAVAQAWLGLSSSFPIQMYNAIFFPLQGLFNFIVFIYPKVLHERQANPQSSFVQAFRDAMRANLAVPVARRRVERRRSHNSMVVRTLQDVVVPLQNDEGPLVSPLPRANSPNRRQEMSSPDEIDEIDKIESNYPVSREDTEPSTEIVSDHPVWKKEEEAEPSTST